MWTVFDVSGTVRDRRQVEIGTNDIGDEEKQRTTITRLHRSTACCLVCNHINKNNVRLLNFLTYRAINNTNIRHAALYTEGLSTAELLPHTAHSGLINRTGLTS